MSLLNILSFSLFVIFLSSYGLKLVILYKKNRINANVLAKGDKDNKIKRVEAAVKACTFIWGVIWLAEIFIGKYINKNVYVLYSSNIFNYIGILVIAIGISTFVTAMISMKASWRVGIDKSTKTKLVTYGIYNYSRNPAFVGVYLMSAGVFLTYPNIITLITLIANIVSIHRLILQEEKHLESLFGAEYISYKGKTPRYL